MAILLLESPTDSISFDEQMGSGKGFQAHASGQGFGMPEADVQWFEGAGSGAVYRGRRVQSRDIELNVSILADNREELQTYLDRLSAALSQPCKLVRVEDDETRWILEVVHVGGGDYLTGQDSDGETYWESHIQLRSGRPQWRREELHTEIVVPDPDAGEHQYGSLVLDNESPAEVYPVYTLQGPATELSVLDDKGEGFVWNGTLTSSDTLIVDTGTGLVTDDIGNSRYGALAAAPKLNPLKPGANHMQIMLTGGSTGGATALAKASLEPIRINEFPNPALTATSGTNWIRRNMCPNPRSQTNTVGYYAYSGSHTVEYLHRQGGHPRLGDTGWLTRMLFRNGVGSSSIYLSPAGAHLGGVITASAWVRFRRSTTVRPFLRYSEGSLSSSTVTDTYAGLPVTVSGGEWVRLSMTRETPSGSHVRFGVLVPGAVVGDWCDLTDVLIEPCTSLRDYFDGSTNPHPGITLSPAWDAGTHSSPSRLNGNAPSGWTGVNGLRCWVSGQLLRVLTDGDEGVLYGPTVPHNFGDPWVGTIRARGGGTGHGPWEGRFSIRPNWWGAPPFGTPVAQSPVIQNPGGVSYLSLNAQGGGEPAGWGITEVRPYVEFFTPNTFACVNKLLMERSSSLPTGAYFDGSIDPSITHGINEWEGAEQDSRSLKFPAKYERASMLTIAYEPRRWMVI